jgi:hypothetical protein
LRQEIGARPAIKLLDRRCGIAYCDWDQGGAHGGVSCAGMVR